jgi:hypothetical protein
MRTFALLCALFWVFPAYAQEPLAEELPAGEMSVEELLDITPEHEPTSKKIDIPAVKESPPEAEEKKPTPKSFNAVELKGLNKVTARSTKLTANFGTVMRFGNLEIIPHRCVERTQRGLPDHAALLEIWELKPDASPARLFQGWMFSSNQAVSAVEHPVYDVWVVKCITKELKE